jgi:hypothetical protein
MATSAWIYLAYDGTRLICCAATATEARRKYAKVLAAFYKARNASGVW